MDTLLSIFLYLNIVASPGVYTTSQIDILAAANSAQITLIENNPTLLNLAVSEFYKAAEGITILDGLEG